MRSSAISSTALKVLELDSKYIVEKGVLDPRLLDNSLDNPGRVRRGVVMGAVQSGKTASMLGVAAFSIDQGIDVIVILAGSTKSLWSQTLQRIRNNLDLAGQSEEIRNRSRLIVPQVDGENDPEEGLTPKDHYRMNRAHILRMVRERKPVIAVAMKNVHHIKALAEVLHERVYPVLEDVRESYSILVLDDEADDGSILDARVEQQLNPATDDLKQLPRAIVDLWERRPHQGSTASEKLNVVYVAYTATPYANFLQSALNPLAPKDFAISLRTPYDIGSVSPRQTTFADPSGIGSFYIGGETFYRRLSPGTLCIPVGQDDNENLRSALRTYLISAAISLVKQGKSYSELIGYEFDSLEEVKALSPNPRTMLIHTSSVVEDHFDAAANLLSAIGGISESEASVRISSGERSLPVLEILESLESDENSWINIFNRLCSNTAEVRTAFGLVGTTVDPETSNWIDIRNALSGQIIPNVRLSIVNSDPLADERPRFTPIKGSNGMWRVAPDLLTIFISGNVMSRGLTLEGLTTTLFLRRSNDPLADTQMQMQRWFGYRGSYLDLCQVFLPSDQLDLFGKYHEADEALRRSLISAMNEESEMAPGIEVLQGLDFSATGKLTNLNNWPISPGPAPFFPIVSSSFLEDQNSEVIANLFKSRQSSDVVVGGTLRGRICDQPLSLSEAADFLDQLLFNDYRPSNDGRHARRWKTLESHVGISTVDEDSDLIPFFRPPEVHNADPSEVSSNCPYSVAAYLRLWSSCLTRHARGVAVIGSPDVPWSMTDLRTKQATQPKFYVGIRYGSGQVVEKECLKDLPFQIRASVRSTRENRIVSTWGSQNPGTSPDSYLGDQFFDMHFHGLRPTAFGQGSSSWRAEGAPGQILFYFVEDEFGNLRSPVAGVVIPSGGPEQIAAIVK